MLVIIDDVLTADELTTMRRLMADSAWVSGQITAGTQAALSKKTSSCRKMHPIYRHCAK